MLKSLLDLYYTILAYVFYYLGDLFWRIPVDFCYHLYQKSMILSVKYDDLSENKIWKVPEEQHNKEV
jgi:hypothetical protein